MVRSMTHLYKPLFHFSYCKMIFLGRSNVEWYIMTRNKEFGKFTDGGPGDSIIARESKSICKMSIYSTEDKLLFSP